MYRCIGRLRSIELIPYDRWAYLDLWPHPPCWDPGSRRYRHVWANHSDTVPSSTGIPNTGQLPNNVYKMINIQAKIYKQNLCSIRFWTQKLCNKSKHCLCSCKTSLKLTTNVTGRHHKHALELTTNVTGFVAVIHTVKPEVTQGACIHALTTVTPKLIVLAACQNWKINKKLFTYIYYMYNRSAIFRSLVSMI